MATFTPNTFERPIAKIPGLVPARWPYVHLRREEPPAPEIEGNKLLRISTPALRPIGPLLPVIAEEENGSGPNNNPSYGPALPQTTSTSSHPRRVRRSPRAYHVSQPHEHFLNELAISNYVETEGLEGTSQ